MQNLEKSLVPTTLETIASAVSDAADPALFISFGKDSMAILGLLREADLLKEVSLVSFRHPAFPGRYTFADRVIREWQLSPVIVQHAWNSILSGNGRVDLVASVSARGSRVHLPVANMVWTGGSGSWACALDNEMARNGDLVQLDYDLILLGSKNCDSDPVVGRVDVRNSVEKYHGRPSLLFPLQNWSDEDVWEYIRSRQIPCDHRRYVRTSNRDVVDDSTYSLHPEYLPVCTACVNPASFSSVWCPKKCQTVPRRTDSIQHREYPPRRSLGVPEVVAL